MRARGPVGLLLRPACLLPLLQVSQMAMSLQRVALWVRETQRAG